eukprot:GHVS01099736.1.p1 GENE.GHVS01099736.1~~GHVS01099736.1.p1  ORF type:complete len:392 (-),score=42.26 GHVS01099736.1:180-1355(-)
MCHLQRFYGKHYHLNFTGPTLPPLLPNPSSLQFYVPPPPPLTTLLPNLPSLLNSLSLPARRPRPYPQPPLLPYPLPPLLLHPPPPLLPYPPPTTHPPPRPYPPYSSPPTHVPPRPFSPHPPPPTYAPPRPHPPYPPPQFPPFPPRPLPLLNTPNTPPLTSAVPNRNKPKIRKTTCGLRLAAWNVRTLNDAPGAQVRRTRTKQAPERRTAFVAMELNRLNVDIAALSECRIPGQGVVEEPLYDYCFYHSGRDSSASKQHGVAVAIRTRLVSSIVGTVYAGPRHMTLSLEVSNNKILHVVSVYSDSGDKRWERERERKRTTRRERERKSNGLSLREPDLEEGEGEAVGFGEGNSGSWSVSNFNPHSGDRRDVYLGSVWVWWRTFGSVLPTQWS